MKKYFKNLFNSGTESDEKEPGKPGADGLTDEKIIPVEKGVLDAVIKGEITVLDTTTNSFSLKSGDGIEKSFSVINGVTILWKGIMDIELSDIKEGDIAQIGYYTNDSGKLVASWVDIIH